MVKKKEKSSEEQTQKKEIKLSFEQVLAMYQQNQQLLEAALSQESFINNIIAEIDAAQNAIREIKTSEKDTSILVPLGAGVFAYAKISEPESVKLEIGNNYFEKMPSLKAIERLEARKSQLKTNLKEVSKRKMQAITSLSQLEKIIKEAQKKMAQESTPGVA
ncbi:MAG: prefoldin subunit alpha [Candidatus Diapherotrites archaeon]|nr:prefoldin subunit alpha [Candidatus Diapherotrites archaeon]